MKKHVIFLAFCLIIFMCLHAVQNCLDFNYDQVNVDHDASLNMGTGGITIEAWIKTSANVSENYWPVIVTKDTWGTRQGFNLFIAHNTNRIAFEIWVNNEHHGVWGQVINDGKWHHVVGRRTVNRIYVLKDGSQSGGWVQAGSDGNVNVNDPLRIGDATWGTTGNFDGMIEEVRIWNRSLSNEEIQEMMFKELDGTEANLQAYYQFNETSGSFVPDLTVNNNDGTNSADWIASNAPIASVLLENLCNIRGIWNAKTLHTSSIMTISDTDISGNQRIIFGHNDASESFDSYNVPSGIENRLSRVWRLEEYSDLTGDIIFDCSGFSTRIENYRLLVDNDGDFSDASVFNGIYDLLTFTVSNHQFEHSYYYTLAIAQGVPPSYVTLESIGDTYIHSVNSTINYGSEVSVRVGSVFDPAYDTGIKRGFVKFDTEEIPMGSTINSIILKAYQTDGTIGQGFQVLPVLEEWDEFSLNWDNQPIVGSSIGIMNMVSEGICSFEDDDLLNLAQNWVDGNSENFGLSFQFHDENYENASSPGTVGDTFAARENSNEQYIPIQLTIEYHQLAAPIVTISTENSNITLNWEAVTGATSYKVYSSDDPYDGFTEDLTGTFAGESWSAPATNIKKFYFVKALN